MSTPLDTLPLWIAIPVALLLIIGSTLTMLGALGLVRLNSFYDRIHAPTLGTSWGTAGIMLASMLAYSWLDGRAILHELVIGSFVMITTPITLMLLSRAALHRDRMEGNPDVPPTSAPPED
ncbi:monovalent cation/H(+) antiporter subunit G [Gemmobacter serpentinus]|uniref:monovalent cation/H(+) antiporter subunit G n=1 Tax=Gemmobacter serpentinus TaxID=2652247 RepID=UPI00124CA18B|nr:monovalent cation/H(+) antiporter subunit G [Gemmobacter serpentinus]